MPKLFVYGSLKQGFPNHHANRGRRLAGEYRTLEPHPLWLVDGVLPCLLPASAQGLPVRGQVFEVSAEDLAVMDALERVGEPGGYRRELVAVHQEGEPTGTAFEAFAYLQDPRLLATRPGPHLGPLEEYTAAHAASLRW